MVNAPSHESGKYRVDNVAISEWERKNQNLNMPLSQKLNHQQSA
jgi:hypothetical protein